MVPRPLPCRSILAALVVVLVGLLGGAEHRGPPRAPVVLPARLGEDAFLVGGRLFIVGHGVATAYRLPDGKQLGRTPIAVPGSVMQLVPAGDRLLVLYQVESGFQAVTAVAEGSGRQLWHRNAALMAISVADGLVLFGDEHTYSAVDLATGALRWQLPRPADGYIAEAGAVDGYPRWLLQGSGSGRLAVHDARTGGLLAATSVPVHGRQANGLVWPVGDYFLAESAAAGFDAYHLPDLSRAWHTTTDLWQNWAQVDCGPVVCGFNEQRGMVALDPADGRELWRSDRWVDVEPRGRYLVATAADQGGVWVLDPATGRELGGFGDWRALGAPGRGTVYGTLDLHDGYRLLYGVLDPVTRRARVLGSADKVSGGCEVGAGVLMCRLVDASVALWRLG